MNRLEAAKKIAEIEDRKQVFEAILHDVSDYYCQKVFIGADVVTNAFGNKRKYGGSSIEVDVALFKDYLKSEIDKLAIASDDIVNEVLK